METEYFQHLDILHILLIFKPLSPDLILGLVLILVLLLLSALISGSETAFFSLTPAHISKLNQTDSKSSKRTLQLLEKPQLLLATILVGNNFVNIGIVILSSYVSESLIDFSSIPQWLSFAIQIIVITFLILLFGEIIPKLYANQNSMNFAISMSGFLTFLNAVFKPFSTMLLKMSKIVDRKFSKKEISMDDISEALNITTHGLQEDKDILEGIVKLQSTDVKEIMKSRLDVVSIEISLNFDALKEIIIGNGYSRIPVYRDNFDNLKGILYVKDLLPHIHKPSNFKWQTLIRAPYFVPQSKKIDDLLEEFQKAKVHMAIVIDEYGGTSGIVTMEDILEEIVGEINDEHDEEKLEYEMLDDNTYIFDGKVLLNDFHKITNTESTIFDEIKGDADTLAGLILEIKGDFPEINEEIIFRNITFFIEAEDQRRIQKIKVIIDNDKK